MLLENKSLHIKLLLFSSNLKKKRKKGVYQVIPVTDLKAVQFTAALFCLDNGSSVGAYGCNCDGNLRVSPSRLSYTNLPFRQRMAHQWLRTLNDLRQAVHGPVNYSAIIIWADRESFSNENQLKWSVANSDSIGSTVVRVRIIVRRAICINAGEQCAPRWIDKK